MSDITKEIKELHALIGNAYCLYELSDQAFELWLKMIEKESK